nr:SpaA isopeptide-forming pilin-related protein [uncultured Solibaculum sp.]
MRKQKEQSFLGKKRIAAICMVVILLLACYFAESLVALAQNPSSLTPRAADPSTMTNWTQSFGQNVLDTSSAGRIWTDKTVSDGDVLLQNEDGHQVVAVERSGEENFLVSLSAISSNKSIVGQDTIPIDVMLVLDVSGSMVNSDSVPSLVSATNSAIKKLLQLNVNNRVGVILFSGNSAAGSSDAGTASVLLDLNRYRSNEQDQFISYTVDQEWVNDWIGGHWEDIYTISVANNITYEESQQKVDENKKAVEGGTYIQNGLYQAWQQFSRVEDTAVDGVKRIPVMVLMGDGAPTAATNGYSNVQTSTTGNGTSTSDTIGFYTQLTAAYTRAQMREHYGREPLFYTLGLGINGLEGNQKQIAQWVLNPESTPEPGSGGRWDPITVGNYWERFLTLGAGDNLRDWDHRDYPDVTRADDGIGESDQVYADQYFEATDSQGLEGAFEQIVQEIILQSQYYPTDIGSDGANFSGYLTFQDPLGEYMEVKKVNGLVCGDKLHTGKDFARTFRDGFHPESGGSDLTFLRSVMERLSITNDQAIELINNAIGEGQIYYRDENDFGNVIMWYGKGDSADQQQYIGPYIEGEEAPSDAKYLNYSYSYYGTSGSHTATGADMMYISARVATELATDKQTVLLKVPSSLVPMVRYKVTIDGKDLENAKVAGTTRQEAYPMRFFYEEGLKDVNADNVQFLVRDGYEHYDDASGTYSFYTNDWTEKNGQKTANTVVTFEPSQENEFYCFYRDTKIYTDQDGTLATNWRVQPKEGYYLKQTFTVTSSAQDKVPIKTEYAEIQTGALRHAQWNEQDGYWYIPMGTSRYAQADYDMDKTQNATETAGYSINPHVVGQGNKTSVAVYLGNNGRLQLRQTLGDVKIQKAVTGNHGEKDRDFEFSFILKHPDDTPFIPLVDKSYTYTKTIQGQKDPKEGTITIGLDGAVTIDGAFISLKDGEDIVIHDLPTGTKFTVTETDPNASGEGYETSITINGGDPIAGREASGEIMPPGTEGITSTQAVIFTNHWEVPDVPFSFTKVDGKNQNLPLEGAQFQMFRLTCSHPEDGHVHTGVDGEGLLDVQNPGTCWELVKTVSSDVTGAVDFGRLIEGTYRLVETTAPDGYSIPKGQWEIQVDPDGTLLTEQIVIQGRANPPAVQQIYDTDGQTVIGYQFLNNKPMDPPVTGGRGTNQFILLGSLTMALGIGGIFCARRGAKRYRRL